MFFKLLESSYSKSTRITADGPRTKQVYTLALKNLGISLHSVQVVLQFRMADGNTLASVPLRRVRSQPAATDEFGKGMIGEFGFDVDALTESNIYFLNALRDPNAQRALFRVYAQGYRTKKFRVGGFLDSVRQNWNSAIVNTYCRTMRGRNPDSSFLINSFTSGGIMFPALAFHLMCLVRDVQPKGRPRTSAVA